MKAFHNSFLSLRASAQTGIIRNTFFPPSQPSYARNFSGLVSASLRKQLRIHKPTAYSTFYRHNSSIQPTSRQRQAIADGLETTHAENASKATTTAAASEAQRSDTPAYEITFTCKPCQTRSTHKISKQGYHKGTILITCPDCKNRHLICDHLNIFRDQSTTIEDILKEKGEYITRGTLGEEGDIEIWDEGTNSKQTETLAEIAKP